MHNLRSSVSRLAIVTLGDMFDLLGKNMDPELELTVGALLKKISAEQGSTFIREDVDKCLEKMSERVSPQKALAALMSSASVEQKSNLVRRTGAKFISDFVGILGAKVFYFI